jgi:hypothetical protein
MAPIRTEAPLRIQTTTHHKRGQELPHTAVPEMPTENKLPTIKRLIKPGEQNGLTEELNTQAQERATHTLHEIIPHPTEPVTTVFELFATDMMPEASRRKAAGGGKTRPSKGTKEVTGPFTLSTTKEGKDTDKTPD